MPQKPRTVAFLLWLLPLALPSVPPAAGASSVILHWTAPGDDGRSGRATGYDLRYSTRSAVVLAFTSATSATGLPVPRSPGSLETYTLTGLAADSTYYVAIKTIDDAGNRSVLSNLFIRPAPSLDVEHVESEAGIAEPWPNPAHSTIQLSIRLPRAAATQVQVYDVAARRIRSLDQEWHGAGAIPVRWDLRDEQGRRVSPGAYIIRVRALGKEWTRRVVVDD